MGDALMIAPSPVPQTATDTPGGNVRIRRLQIDNFRGIKHLDWTLPTDQRLITLIGPGDSGKSTILDAIHLLLGDRWMVPFSDTDFYDVDVGEAIRIRAVLADLPPSLKKDSTFGLSLSGIGPDGGLFQDPVEGTEPAVIVRLEVESDLEPRWMVARANGDTQHLTGTQRRAFSTFKVDDRTDAQLRWSRTSALGRLSASDGGERAALASAARAARETLADHTETSLNQIAARVQAKANKVGGGRFHDIKPGLDTSRSSTGAALALYDDNPPHRIWARQPTSREPGRATAPRRATLRRPCRRA